MYCPKCGNTLESEQFEFCPKCGYQLVKSQIKFSEKSVYQEVFDCWSTVKDAYEIQKSITDLDNETMQLRLESEKELQWSTITFVSAALSIIVLAAINIFFVVLFSFFKLENIVEILPYFVLVAFVVLFFISLPIAKSWGNKELIKKKRMIEDQIELVGKEKSEYLSEMENLFNSEKGKLAVAVIPQDYFYPQAVERFLFYLKNGHADTMKEAIKEYDQYLHRCKLEYEATRAADANERSARAAERSAEISAEMRNSILTMEQYQRNTNFWVSYLGFKDIFSR